MRSVGDNDDMAQLVVARDRGKPVHLLLRIERMRLGNDVLQRNAVCEKVVPPHCSFRVAGVFIPSTAKRNHDGSNLLAVQVDGVVEPEVQRRRWMPCVLRSPEDRDGVGLLRLIVTGHLGDRWPT